MYLVAGVTGHTGSVVASTLLAQGKKVRVLVRSEAKGESWKQKGAEVAVGSVEDGASITSALTGTTGAFLLVPPDMQSPDVLARGKRIVDAITQAATASKVPHVVFLSSVGSQHETGTGLIRTTAYAERALGKVTSTKWTFVRPVSFMENLEHMMGAVKGQGVLPVFNDPSYAFPWIATHDIGTTVAKALLETPTQNEVIELEGPAHYSYNDAAAALQKVLGKPVKTILVPNDQIVPSLLKTGMSEDAAKLYKEMVEGVDKGLLRFAGGSARHLQGATTLESVVNQIAKH